MKNNKKMSLTKTPIKQQNTTENQLNILHKKTLKQSSQNLKNNNKNIKNSSRNTNENNKYEKQQR